MLRKDITGSFIALSLLLTACSNSSEEKQEATAVVHEQEPPKPKLSTAEAVKMAEQQFDDYLPEILRKHDAVIDLRQPHSGDFTGDGVEDVAIYFSLSPKGGGNALAGQGLTLYRNDGDRVSVIGGYEPDYLFAFDTIANGRIQVEKLEYADGDGRCCPSIKTKHVLTISGSKVY